MTATKLIAAYGRVSTSTQEKEGTIESQLQKVRETAKEKGFTIVKEYTDDGWSGSILARPALDRLRQDAKKKLWEAVLVYDPDRIARNGSYQELIREELEDAGIELLFVTVPPPKSDEDKIMNKMRAVFSEYERMKITERFRLGKVRKANEGHVIATEAPFGYMFVVKRGKKGDLNFQQSHYVINEAEAETIKKIFIWVADEGLTLRAVVRKLKGLGISPRKSKRGVWSTSTLSTLLRNRTYIGEAHYGATYAVVPEKPLKAEGYKKNKKTSRRNKPESEWIKIKVPVIIDEDLFKRAGERLRRNFESSVRNTKNEYLLAGHVWCTCGKRRAGEGPQCGKHLYYRCTDRVKSFPLPPSCSEKGINARIADKLVWDKVSALMSSPHLLQKQVQRYLNDRKKPMSMVIDIESTKKEITKLKDQIDRYTKAYGAGAFSVDQLKEYISPIKTRIVSLEEEVSKVEQEAKNLEAAPLPNEKEIAVFTEKASQKLKNLNFESKQAIVRSVIQKVVGTKTQLEVFGYIPININVFPSYRHRRIAKRR